MSYIVRTKFDGYSIDGARRLHKGGGGGGGGGGGRAIANKENFDQLAAWCREHGHTRLRGSTFTPATRLWQRLGMKEIYRVMETAL